MSELDKLRNALRTHYDNQPASFTDAEWDRASAHLNKARQGRKIRNSIFFAVTALLFIWAVVGIMPKSKNPEKLQTTSKRNSEKRIVATKAPFVNSNFVPNPGKEYSTPVNKPDHLTIAGAEAIPKSSNDPVAAEPPVDAIISKTIDLETNHTAFEEKMATPQPTKITRDPALSIVDTSSFTNNSFVPVAMSETSKQDYHQEQAVREDANAIIRQNLLLQPENMHTPEGMVPQPASNTPSIAGEPALNNVTGVVGETQTHTETKAPAFSDVRTKNIEATASPGSSNDTVAFGEVNYPDTLFTVSYFDQLIGNGIFYEVGAAWLYGWKGTSRRDATGFSPIASINYSNRFNKRTAISFGIGYLQVSNLSNSSKTSRVSSYLYGEHSRVTVITPSSLYYLQAPFRFHYCLNPRNSVSAGFNLAYLLNVDAKVLTYDERPGTSENYKTITLGGYTQGFSWFDSQLAFGYRRKIRSALSVQAEIFLGIADVKSDEFFSAQGKERNSGVKLSLVYNVLSKNNR